MDGRPAVEHPAHATGARSRADPVAGSAMKRAMDGTRLGTSRERQFQADTSRRLAPSRWTTCQESMFRADRLRGAGCPYRPQRQLRFSVWSNNQRICVSRRNDNYNPKWGGVVVAKGGRPAEHPAHATAVVRGGPSAPRGAALMRMVQCALWGRSGVTRERDAPAAGRTTVVARAASRWSMSHRESRGHRGPGGWKSGRHAVGTRGRR